MIPQSKKINIPGLTLHAKVWGNPVGMPTLAAHGWLDNSGTFDHLAPLLKDHYIVAIDLPGHGFSDHLPVTQPYEHVTRAFEIIQVADALGWDQFALIGHSLGGIVSQIVSATVPDRVLKCVLIDVVFFLFKPPSTTVEQLSNYSQAKHHLRDHTLYKSFDDAVLSRINNNITGELSVQAATALARGGVQEVPGGYSWTFDLRLLLPTHLVLTREQGVAIANAIKSQLLLIKSKGSFLDDRGYGNILKHYDDLTIIEVDGGHHLHLDNPEPVAEAISTFFSK